MDNHWFQINSYLWLLLTKIKGPCFVYIKMKFPAFRWKWMSPNSWNPIKWFSVTMIFTIEPCFNISENIIICLHKTHWYYRSPFCKSTFKHFFDIRKRNDLIKFSLENEYVKAIGIYATRPPRFSRKIHLMSRCVKFMKHYIIRHATRWCHYLI